MSIPQLKFNIEKEGDDIVLSQQITRRIPLGKAVGELNKMQHELMEFQQQRMQIQKQVDENVLEENIKRLDHQIESLIEVEKKWNEILEPVTKEFEKKIVSLVKKEKAKIGYNRISDTTQKIIKQNEILAPIVANLGLELNSSLVRGIKARFDKI